MRVIDADGHVNDRLRMEEVAKYMPKGNQFPPVFPELDHLHTYFLRKNRAVIRTGNPGPKEWIEFIDNTGIEWTVVYPTSGLAVGRIVNEDWAIAACKAYNNWLYDRFLNISPRIKGMALIPLQNVDSAVEELNRAVKQLGMLGAMLPSNGEGLKTHLGSHFIGLFMRKPRSSIARWACTEVATTILGWILLTHFSRCKLSAILSASWCKRLECW